VLARHAARFAAASTLSQTLSASDNTDRVEARLATLDPTCVTLTRRSATELTAVFKSRCFTDSGTDQVSVYLLRDTVRVDIASENPSTPAIHLERRRTAA
jgi:hypothetical protein